MLFDPNMRSKNDEIRRYFSYPPNRIYMESCRSSSKKTQIRPFQLTYIFHSRVFLTAVFKLIGALKVFFGGISICLWFSFLFFPFPVWRLPSQGIHDKLVYCFLEKNLFEKDCHDFADYKIWESGVARKR